MCNSPIHIRFFSILFGGPKEQIVKHLTTSLVLFSAKHFSSPHTCTLMTKERELLREVLQVFYLLSRDTPFLFEDTKREKREEKCASDRAAPRHIKPQNFEKTSARAAQTKWVWPEFKTTHTPASLTLFDARGLFYFCLFSRCAFESARATEFCMCDLWGSRSNLWQPRLNSIIFASLIGRACQWISEYVRPKRSIICFLLHTDVNLQSTEWCSSTLWFFTLLLSHFKIKHDAQSFQIFCTGISPK